MSKTQFDFKTFDAIGHARKALEQLYQRLSSFGCCSVTMFVRDPVLPYYLRTVTEWNVSVPELIHGPLSVDSIIGATMMEHVDDVDPEWFFDDKLAALDATSNDPTTHISSENRIYQSFIKRENVVSAALHRFIIRGEVQACVWINFSRKIERAPQRLRKMLRTFKSTFAKSIPELLQQMSSKVPSRIRRFQRLHKAAKNFPECTTGTTIEDYLQEFLSAALEVCGIGAEGFGTIYLLDDSKVLRKVVQRGQIAKNAKSTFSVSLKEGVVSAAVARHTPLIVELPAHKLDDIYVCIDDPASKPTLTRREVVVPLIVADKVVGVMNLETKQEKPNFDETDVFDLAIAGFRVASSIRVAEQTSKSHQIRTMAMLRIASRAIYESEPAGLREELQDWAQTAFGADQCSIWQWCNVSRRFVPDSHPACPRECGGFSKFIHETKRMIWWSASNDPEALDLLFWNDKDEQWSNALPSHSWLPEGVNDHLKGDGITHQLGMPVVFLGQCIGVVWFKFFEPLSLPPLPSRIQLAKGLTAEIGLILQLKRRHEEFIEEAAMDDKLREFYSNEFPTGPFEFQGGHGYAIVQPCGTIGGDFYSQVKLRDSTGFIVADGENHGFVGATSMLPMYTAFRICAREFLSPRHILWKMNDLLEVVDHVRGSAVCFLVDCSRDTPRLIVSSAAHPKIMISRPGMFLSLPKGAEEGFQLGVGRELYYDNLLEESRFDLQRGDMVVAITDGVSEAGEKGASGSFGTERIALIIQEMRTKGPKAVAVAIKEAMLRHCEDILFDDYTILVIQIS